MAKKVVYQTDRNGRYIGETFADESPREPGIFLLPDGCVEEEPPPAPEGKMQVYAGDAWTLVDIPQPPQQPPPTEEEKAAEKLVLLTGARASREIILNRLTGHRVDAREAIIAAQEVIAAAQVLREAAVLANDSQAIAALDLQIVEHDQNIADQKSDLAGMAACKASLLDVFADPRVVAAVDGEVKDVVKQVYAEIASALYNAAPRVYIAFKGLDHL